MNGACKHGDLAHMKEVLLDFGGDVVIEHRDDLELLALQGAMLGAPNAAANAEWLRVALHLQPTDARTIVCAAQATAPLLPWRSCRRRRWRTCYSCRGAP